MNRRYFLITASAFLISAGIEVLGTPASATEEEAVLVLDSSHNGCPNYDPIRGTFLNLS